MVQQEGGNPGAKACTATDYIIQSWRICHIPNSKLWALHKDLHFTLQRENDLIDNFNKMVKADFFYLPLILRYGIHLGYISGLRANKKNRP
jgi:hypothetical protein